MLYLWGGGPCRQGPEQSDRVGSMQCRVGTRGRNLGLCRARPSCCGGGRGQHQGQWPGRHTWKTLCLLPAPAVTSTTRDDFLVVHRHRPAPRPLSGQQEPAGGGQGHSTTWRDEGWGEAGALGDRQRGWAQRAGSSLTEASSLQLGCVLWALFLLHSSQRATCQVDLRGDSCSGWTMGQKSLQLYLAVLFRWCERLGLGAGDRAAAAAREAQGSLAHNLLFMDQAWEDWTLGRCWTYFTPRRSLKPLLLLVVINRVIIIGHDGKVPCPD